MLKNVALPPPPPPTQDLDKAFAKYRDAYHVGSKSKTSEARRRREQRKKIKEQEIERFE